MTRRSPAHSRHNGVHTFQGAQAYVMKSACALGSSRGFQSRSLNWQRPKQARAHASDGQPENLVGRIGKTETTFKHSRMERGASRAAFPRGAWERSIECGRSLPHKPHVHPKVIGRLSGRHREQARSHRKAGAKQPSSSFCFSPLNTMSVSSSTALAVPAPSEG